MKSRERRVQRCDEKRTIAEENARAGGVMRAPRARLVRTLAIHVCTIDGPFQAPRSLGLRARALHSAAEMDADVDSFKFDVTSTYTAPLIKGSSTRGTAELRTSAPGTAQGGASTWASVLHALDRFQALMISAHLALLKSRGEIPDEMARNVPESHTISYRSLEDPIGEASPEDESEKWMGLMV